MKKYIILLALIGITSLNAFECIKTTFSNGRIDHSTVVFRDGIDTLTMKWNKSIYYFNYIQSRKVSGGSATQYSNKEGHIIKIFNGVDTTFHLKINGGQEITFENCSK